MDSTIKYEVPDDGNKAVKGVHWTESEKKAMDLYLMAWARWEVDYTNGFVRSTKCRGTTTNKEGICNPCQKVAADESFKKAVRRVWGFLVFFVVCAI
jgi:hypothetical protein